VEDLFDGIETLPKMTATAGRPVPPPPLPVSSSGYGKVVALILVLLILGGGGAGAWYMFSRQTTTLATSVTESPTVSSTTNPTSADQPVIPPAVTVNDLGGTPSTPTDPNTVPVEVVPLPTPVTTPPAGVPLPSTQPTPVETAPNPSAPVIPTAPTAPGTVTPSVQFDSDGDGLSDQREAELGTDPLKPDTDGDTLKDGDEVLKYGTNPLNVDTDGDGFPDGVEIQNGFNPRGTGKCSKPSCEL
jgi:hypothetical protein